MCKRRQTGYKLHRCLPNADDCFAFNLEKYAARCFPTTAVYHEKALNFFLNHFNKRHNQPGLLRPNPTGPRTWKEAKAFRRRWSGTVM